MHRQFRVFAVAVALLFAAGMASAADKPLSFGLQASYGEEADFAVGARAIYNLEDVHEGLNLVGSFEYYFPSNEGIDVTYFEVNGDLHYNIPLEDAKVEPYAGAGLNFARASWDGGSESEVGLNLIGGINVPAGNLKLFLEAKLEVEGGDQFVVTAGIRF